MSIEQTRQAAAPTRGILGLPGTLPFTVRHFVPAEDLAWCVERYWISSWDLPEGHVAITRVLPHPCVNVTLEDTQLRVTGVAKGVFSRRLTGDSRVFGVKFHPGAFRLLTSAPLSRLSGTPQSAHGVLPDGEIVERLLNGATSDEARAEVFENFLREKRAVSTPSVRLVGQAVSVLARDAAVTKVSDVVQRLGISERSLQRLFSEYVGVSPGWVLRRGRLHAAAERLIQLTASGGEANLADVAAEFGYADQAHFTRDFRSVLGVPPANWAASLITDEPDDLATRSP